MHAFVTTGGFKTLVHAFGLQGLEALVHTFVTTRVGGFGARCWTTRVENFRCTLLDYQG
jgi:hypothetical protein